MTIYNAQSPKFQQFLAKRKAVAQGGQDAGMGGFQMPDPDNMEPPGMNALARAAWHGKLEECRSLVSEGASLESSDGGGRAALALAAVAGKCEVVKFLIEEKASIDAKDSMGLTALHWAAREGRTAEVELLAEASANLEAEDEDGMTPIKLAALFNHLDVTRDLVKRGANPKAALALAQKFSKRCAETAEFLSQQV
eukprot:TRINITY_DN105245_c0_g1_i1.p1 TRINITY_DN105245_c0_g1~~TRINITY_DN105245_c0_g1_i1.p1  ORF type:complete len:196 (+),score=55.68 TRINITY_DN105245_c0_g1_i1:115-702(+)